MDGVCQSLPTAAEQKVFGSIQKRRFSMTRLTTLSRLLTAPVVLALSLSASAQLSPGDVCVIGIHGDGSSNAAVDGDAFAWVPLVDLAAGEVLYFSDVGYFSFKANNNGFGSDSGEEGLFVYTVPVGGIAAGAVQVLNPMDPTPSEYTLSSGNAYTPDLTQDWVNLSGGGDQLLIFQDDDISDTANFSAIYAATSSTTDWAAAVDGDLIDPNNGGSGSESNLYPGLTAGLSAVAAGSGAGSLDEFDNVRYIGPIVGSPAFLRAQISDPTNWDGTNASQSVSNGGLGSAIWVNNMGIDFTITAPSFAEFCFGDGGNQVGCTNCPCANNAPIGSGGGCLNSSGDGIQLNPSGDPSVSLPSGDTSDLRFSADGAPANAFCILNSGDALAPGNMANPCFGLGSGAQAAAFDGLRCAITNTRRHGGRSADANGEVGVTNSPWGGEGGPPVGLAVAGGGFVSGQTRYFQIINRDDATLGCMRGLNTSQAVEVTFTP